MSVQGMIFDIKRYSIHDGPGIRTTVHFKGCPLSCWWCHNPESQSVSPEILFRSEKCIACGACTVSCPNGAISEHEGTLVTDKNLCCGTGICADVCPSGARELCGRKYSVDKLMSILRKEEIFFRENGGVTFSGGEPLMQPEFLLESLSACKKECFHTALDTCGFAPKSTILACVPNTSLFLYDLKHMDFAKHKEYTGVDNFIILDNLKAISEAGAKINIRFPFMPGLNSDDANVHALGSFCSELSGITAVNILPYHAVAKGKHERWHMPYKLPNLLPPAESQTARAASIIESYGLKVHIGG